MKIRLRTIFQEKLNGHYSNCRIRVKIKMFSLLVLKLDSIWIGAICNKEKLVRISLSFKKESLFADLRISKDKERYSSSLLERLRDDLIDYWHLKKINFDNYPLKLSDYSYFARSVWKNTQRIPYGEVRSYKWIAHKVNTRGYRAVGRVLSLNPFPIIIPCHRVIRNDGGLGGFSAGIEIKKRLLKIEKN